MSKSVEKKAKVLMIGPLPPPVHGSAMMTQYIKDSNLINNHFTLDWINLSTSRKMTEIGKKSPKKIIRFLSSYIKTLFKLSTNNYSFCYLAITCHGLGFLKDAPFALLCKLFRKKILIHQHNKGMSADVNKPLFRRLLNLVYNDSTVVLLSQRLYPDISQIVDESQVKICANGIIEQTISNKENHDIPRLLFLSNLMESKGIYELLDSCKSLNDNGYLFYCDIIGSETKEIDSQKLEREIENRNLKDIVIYHGPKYGDDKQQALSQADIFVFPTDNDCFPLVLLEAMQAGLPTISTDIGGIPDIIQDGKTGYVVPSKDSKTLTDKIKFLLDNPQVLREMGQNAYARFNQSYTLSKFEERINDMFLNI